MTIRALAPQTSLGRGWTAAAVALALYLAGGWAVAGVSGVVRTIVTNTSEPHELGVRRTPAIDLDGIRAPADGQPGILAIWRGAWEVPSSGLYDLALASEGPSSWMLDGVPVIETATFHGGATRRVVWLAAGFHAIEVSYQVDSTRPRIQILAARAGTQPEELTASALKPRPPRNPRVRTAAIWLHRGLGVIVVLLLLFAIRTSILTSERTPRPRQTSIRRVDRAPLRTALAWAALAGILVHGALLRIDAITARYGPVDGVPLVSAVQTRSFLPPEAIRPASMKWLPEPLYAHKDGTATHYRSDPYTYLDAGRSMTSFYGAHFREPVFPFATKIFLALLGGRDVAVSVASAFFSVLAIWLTYVLGAAIWSRPVGLAAALGLSLDHDVITLASSGWRDDAYVVMVVLCTYLMLRWWRVDQGGSPRLFTVGRVAMDEARFMAIVAGVAGGIAILTRIMAVSFLVAGMAYFALAGRAPWRRRLASIALFATTAFLVAAPYFVNCWRVYGDPLYTFNVHGQIYSGAEGQAGWTGTTSAYVREKLAQRPFEMLDTVAQGLTTYPFENKWFGLERWMPGVRQKALLAAIAGLLVLAALARGRLLLVVAVASLVPFSLTWTVDPDFRFTEHVYPPILVAAALSVSAFVRGVRSLLTGVSRVDPRAEGVSWPAWAGTVGAAIVLLWIVYRVGPATAFAESLRVGEEATIAAGVRDGWSFGPEWSNPLRGSNVTVRVTTDEAALSIQLPDAGDYPATIRMDPFPPPLDPQPSDVNHTLDVAVLLNGVGVTTVPLRWTPGRVGAYDVVLPAAAVRRGENRLVLRVNGSGAQAAAPVRRGLTPGEALALWYVRVRPRVDRVK